MFVPFNGLLPHISECATLTIRPSERPSSIYSLMTRVKLSGGGLTAKQIKKKSSNAPGTCCAFIRGRGWGGEKKKPALRLLLHKPEITADNCLVLDGSPQRSRGPLSHEGQRLANILHGSAELQDVLTEDLCVF